MSSSDLPDFPREWPKAAARVAGWLWRTVLLRDGRPVDHGAAKIARAMDCSIRTVQTGLGYLRKTGWLVETGGDEAHGIAPLRSISAPPADCEIAPPAETTFAGGADTPVLRGVLHPGFAGGVAPRTIETRGQESQSLRVSDDRNRSDDQSDQGRHPEPETTTLPSNLQGTTQTNQRAGARETTVIGRYDKTPAQRPHVPGEDPDIHPKAEIVGRCIWHHHPRLIPSAGPDAYQILRELDVLYQRSPESIEAFRFWRPFDGATKPLAVLLTDIRKCRPGEVLTDRAERWRLFLTAPLEWCNEWVARIQPQAAVAVLDLEWTEDDVRDAIAADRARRRAEAPDDPPAQSDQADDVSPDDEAAPANSDALRIRLGIPAPPPKRVGPLQPIIPPRGFRP